jgi:hypothetical protein
MCKNVWIGLLVCLHLSVAHGQYFSIQERRADDPYEGESIFPEIVAPDSKSAFPELAAERINTYLKYDVLMKVHGNEGDSLFSEVFPKENDIGGQGEFSYRVVCNNPRIFTMEISNSFTGAYTEYMDRYYSFDAHTGEHLILHDFFEGAQFGSIITMAAKECASMIRNYLATMDREEEYAQDKTDMYYDCLTNFEGDGVPYFGFYLTDTNMVLTYGRCSNHMMAALDDLWEFNIPFSFETLKPYLSPKGRSLIFNEAGAESTFPPEQKVLTGTLDGKYPIHAIFNSLSSYYGLSGVYWYDKYQKPIPIYGSITGENTYEFWEEEESVRVARLELVFQNGQLMGVWERVDGSSSFPVDLHAR